MFPDDPDLIEAVAGNRAEAEAAEGWWLHKVPEDMEVGGIMLDKSIGFSAISALMGYFWPFLVPLLRPLAATEAELEKDKKV